ncbi:MAG: chromosome segregation protein SMC [Oscillospiraceae bacterium]|nr:chromosome segregation protein SMC [Oscillospiraceae bacterium]
MYLKSLEIQGFKSFPDKITLNFDKGLTAVVGPNGSGKSNIGDSVRWVLGEQSTKTLRGNKMEDIIFSGTVSRKPMGFACVTLNIDNSDKTIPDCDDMISVTRKLYRSGESEYRINGKSVRLKDINELFMDTGLGRDGYSIIGQGKIAEIVSARSTERRSIFEEASGISKFRYKKEESERKLASAQENIIRLSDIISELQSRIEPLKQQSEKAEKFLELSAEQKKIEVSVWVYKLNELKSKLENIQNQQMIKSSEFQSVENDIKIQEEKIQTGYRKMQENNIESDKLRQKILEEEQYSSNIKSDIAVYENDILHSQNNIKSIEEKTSSGNELLERIQSDIDTAEKKTSEIENLLENTESELQKLADELHKAEKKSLESGKLSEKNHAELNSYYMKQNEYRLNIELFKNNIRSAESMQSELEDSQIKSQQIFDEFEQKKSSLQSQLEKNSESLNEIRNKISGTERLYSSAKSRFEESKNELEKILFEHKSKKQRKKILEELENNMEGFSGSVRLILKASKQGRLSGVRGTVAQLIDTEPEYSVAVETVLGGAMQNIIVENEETAKRCIRFLKEEKAGRATFLPITSVRGRKFSEQSALNDENLISTASGLVKCSEEYREIVDSLLGNTAVAEDIDSASVLAKKYKYKFRTVTLDGQLINAGGSFTGGSVQRSAGIFTRKNELERIEREISELEFKRQKLSEDSEKFRSQSEKFRAELKNLNESLKITESEKIRLDTEIKNISENKINAENILKNAQSKREENKNKILEYTQFLESARKNLEDIENKIYQTEKNSESQQNELNQLNKKRNELSGKISDLTIRKAGFQKDLELQKTEYSRLLESENEIQNDLKKFSDEILSQKNIISEKNSLISERKKQLADFKSNAGEYLLKIESLKKLHDEQNIHVRELQKGLKEINISKDKLLGEVTRLKERFEVTQRDFDSIVSQLLETYELTRSEAVKIADKIENIADAQKKLTSLKNQIKALGNVNVGAVEEYKEVSERYKFMSSQLDDVKKAKQELENIIETLTRDMCRMFSESFNIINRNFKSIFRELFGGGSAELILTDPENVLESGIEISVAPPGKVIKNLISLSGGEQSFTAVAIYFAILKLKPSPFCILDEIDAALDESNVARYAQYLKNFTDTTQFILITHRRSAMEEANVLYGVTMQEDGISRLLKMEQY